MTEILRASGLQGSESNHQDHQDGGVGNWLYENVVAPAWDTGIVEPASIVHLKLDPIKYDPAKMTAKPLEWAAQSIGSVAGIIPYVIAGKAVGGFSRLAVESTGREATIFGKFAASERLTQIAGAGLYDFAKPTKNGGGVSERLANAAGGVVSFSLFEYGNSTINPAASWVNIAAKRAGWGVLGGSLGYATQSELGPGHSIDGSTFVQAGISGGLMNALLPPLQKLATDQISTRFDNAIKRGVPVGRYVADSGFGDNSILSDLANNKNTRLTRVSEMPVYRASVRDRLIGSQVILDKNADPIQKQYDLAHELQHQLNAGALEPEYLKAQALADPNSPSHNPIRARQAYLEVRRSDEALAQSRETQSAAEATGHKATALAYASTAESMLANRKFDQFHVDLFNSEADQFVASQGKFRPSESFAGGSGGGPGGPGHGGGGGRGSQDRYGDTAKEDVFKPIDPTNPLSPQFNEKTGETLFVNKITGVPEAKVSLLSREKIENVQVHTAKGTDPKNGEVKWISERMLKAGAFIKNNEYWGSVEFNKFGVVHDRYGFIYDRVERAFDGFSMKYHIKDSNGTDFPAGTNLEVYPLRTLEEKGDGKSGTMTEAHGRADVIERLPNGTVIYWRDGERTGWDYAPIDYETPLYGKVTNVDVRADGSTFRQTLGGAYLETYKTPIRLSIPRAAGVKLPADEMPNAPAVAGSSNKAPTYLVKHALHAADGHVEYQLTDDRFIYVQRVNGEVFVSKKVGNYAVPLEDVSGPVSESYPEKEYPGGKFVKSGAGFDQSLGTEIHPGFNRSFTSYGMVDVYEPPIARTYGADAAEKQVENTKHYLDETVDYTSDKGAYHRYIKPRQNMSQPGEPELRETPRGAAKGVFVDENGRATYDLIGKPMAQPGQSLNEKYTIPLDTSLTSLRRADGSPVLDGVITDVIRETDSTWYLTDAHEAFQVPTTTKGPVIKNVVNADNQIVSREELPVSDIVEYRSRETPFGLAEGTRVSTNGSVQYTMTSSDPNVSDVREYIAPKQIRLENGQLKQVNYAEHLKQNGMYRLKFADGTFALVTDDEAQQLLKW